MRHRTLHELAKFGAGLVTGDLIMNVWVAYMGYYPITFLGFTFTEGIVLPSVVFDAALILILIHYGWNIGKIPALRERTYLLLVGAIFAIVAAAHLVRVFYAIDLVIMGYAVPLWLSWIGTAVVAYLSYMSFRLALRMK
jgi:hypothetical protein